MIVGIMARLGLVGLIASIIIGYLNLSNPTFHEKDLHSKQEEIVVTKKTSVLEHDGKLKVVGWAKSHENFLFNPHSIKPSTSYLSILNNLRYKKWEAFVLVHKDFILGTAIFDLSYLGGYIFHFGDLTKHETNSTIIEKLLPLKRPTMPDSCIVNCQSAKLDIVNEISYEQNKTAILNNQILKINLQDKDLKLDIDLKLNGEGYDNIVTFTPISSDSSLFYYNVKTNALTATGTIKINGKSYDAKDLLLTYDSGRGVWPLRSGWIWVTANGLTTEGKKIGINLGHGFSHPDASRTTEDCFFIDGKIFKLPAVETREIVNENSDNLYEWKFDTTNIAHYKNTCKMTFKPLKKVDASQNLIFAKVEFNLRHGAFTGECKDEEGTIYKFENIHGIIEKKLSVW